MKAFVTGGAGFVGSHIVDRLLVEGNSVTVYDNFSTGKKSFLSPHPELQIIQGDLTNPKKIKSTMKACDFIFHFAANADVRGGLKDTWINIEQNILGTYNVLEAAKQNGIKKIVFSSSATVYGEPEVFPTPEDINTEQTSLYGASKKSGEALIEAYCHGFGMQAWMFRFVSLIGERYSHGVIYDFVKKLLKDNKTLQILGDGNQKKSYLSVEDAVSGILTALERSNDKVNIFNLGHRDSMVVKQVADIICDEMNLKQVIYSYTGGKRGWIGDSPFVHLDTKKISKLGWKPRGEIEKGIRITVKYLLSHKELLEDR